MPTVPTARQRPQPAPAQKKPAFRVIAQNRAAFYDYAILDRYEAGLVLQGTEIKSVREGKVDLRDAYATPENGELWLLNAHIAPYSKGGIHNHDPRRKRKLLLHRNELVKLTAEAAQRGYTIVPLRLYIKGRVAKVELGLARGQRQYEKRDRIAERDAERDMQRAIRRVV
ncbi:MAG: SsrA-binding protein SmpB [Dehalococcoidia bacterium]|nr:SsrA-binding protein SmpB [Dehalococcoidia bacterium]